MIPIKGYATFDPLKSCLIGRNFSGDFFKKNIEDNEVKWVELTDQQDQFTIEEIVQATKDIEPDIW